MAEFIPAMGGGDYTQTTEHNFKRVLSGDVESVRARLAYALERLDYRVLSEQPLMVKRKKAASSCSFNVLRCVKSLTIGLKALNPTSTLVTFDYEILNSVVTKGDRQTIEREAEAIIALAISRPLVAACAICGTNNLGDSHFCRVCGTPCSSGEPAEVEVLRLTAGARYAHQNIIGSLLIAFAVAAVAVPLILLSSKGPGVGFTVLILGELFSLLWLLYGMWRLHGTLNPAKEAKWVSPGHAPRILPSASETTALPPQSARASVTEGTTELLTATERERVAVPAKQRRIDTAEILE